MPGGIPKTGILNSEGKQILSRDHRFNHTWISSRGLYFYDNETCEDIAKCSMVQGEAVKLSTPLAFRPNTMFDLPMLPF